MSVLSHVKWILPKSKDPRMRKYGTRTKEAMELNQQWRVCKAIPIEELGKEMGGTNRVVSLISHLKANN